MSDKTAWEGHGQQLRDSRRSTSRFEMLTVPSKVERLTASLGMLGTLSEVEGLSLPKG